MSVTVLPSCRLKANDKGFMFLHALSDVFGVRVGKYRKGAGCNYNVVFVRKFQVSLDSQRSIALTFLKQRKARR